MHADHRMRNDVYIRMCLLARTRLSHYVYTIMRKYAYFTSRDWDLMSHGSVFGARVFPSAVAWNPRLTCLRSGGKPTRTSQICIFVMSSLQFYLFSETYCRRYLRTCMTSDVQRAGDGCQTDVSPNDVRTGGLKIDPAEKGHIRIRTVADY